MFSLTAPLGQLSFSFIAGEDQSKLLCTQQIALFAASDAMALTSALERYEDIDLNFQGSREGNLLKVAPFETAIGHLQVNCDDVPNVLASMTVLHSSASKQILTVWIGSCNLQCLPWDCSTKCSSS